MRQVAADVYYQSPAGAWSGVAVWYAKQAGKRSIVRIAGDNDCRRGQQPMRHRRDRWLFDYALRNASLVAAQTEKQRQLLVHNYGVHSELLDIAVDAATPTAARSKDIDVLWVGNFRHVKRPDIVLELARRLPSVRFAIVGGSVPSGKAYFERIANEAKTLPNVVMTGAVPYDAVGDWFERSRIHVNTSDSEGFPNTFLQAWTRSVPVVSFFDPDGLIERRNLGRRCVDLDDMCAAIGRLLRDPAASAAIGERARAFVSSQYSAQHIARKYLELLDRRSASPLESKLGDRSVGAVREL
jgi:glycosyltransferase involved in cell wall biosynthesis